MPRSNVVTRLPQDLNLRPDPDVALVHAAWEEFAHILAKEGEEYEIVIDRNALWPCKHCWSRSRKVMNIESILPGGERTIIGHVCGCVICRRLGNIWWHP